MADDLGSIAWSFLPENEQLQYLQKIALRAENPSGPKHIALRAENPSGPKHNLIALRIEQIYQISAWSDQIIR